MCSIVRRLSKDQNIRGRIRMGLIGVEQTDYEVAEVVRVAHKLLREREDIRAAIATCRTMVAAFRDTIHDFHPIRAEWSWNLAH